MRQVDPDVSGLPNRTRPSKQPQTFAPPDLDDLAVAVEALDHDEREAVGARGRVDDLDLHVVLGGARAAAT
jgi:hypothetical protein